MPKAIRFISHSSLDAAIAMDNVLMLTENLQFISQSSEQSISRTIAFTVTPTY
jgi:hypothetical protein